MAGTVARAEVGRNAALLAAATVAARVLTFGLAIALGRGLGAEAYGRYGFAAALATVLAPIADLGLTQYVIREVARRGEGAPGLTRRCLRVKVAASGATLIVVSIAAALLVDNVELRVAITALSAASMFDGISQLVYGWFQGQERMSYEATATTVAALARASGGIALVLAGADLVPVVAWIAAVSVTQAAWVSRRLRQVLPHNAGSSHRISWSSVAAMGLVTLFTMIYLRADSVLLGSMQGDRVVGWYTAAYTVVGALQIPAWMLAIALGPVFARTHLRDPPAFAATWHEGLRIVTVIALPLALVVCLLAGGVVQELYGRAFARAGDALAILVWSTPILAWNMVVAAALRGARREHLLTAVTGAGAALNVGLNLWAIPRFGMEGAAAVTVATEAAVLLALAASAIRGETVTVPRLPLARIIAALAALAAVTLALDTLTVVLAAAGGLAAYLASLVVTGAVGRADIARVRRAVART